MPSITSSIFGFVYQGERERSPHYQKLYSRVPHIWGNRIGQPVRSAMDRPRHGRTALLITVSPEPGKYARKLLGGTIASLRCTIDPWLDYFTPACRFKMVPFHLYTAHA